MRKTESQREDLNLRPADYESAALPTELRWLIRFQGIERQIENSGFTTECQYREMASFERVMTIIFAVGQRPC